MTEEELDKYINQIISKPSGPIAQLDRVPDYESGGRGFESSSVRHFCLLIKFKLTELLLLPRGMSY